MNDLPYREWMKFQKSFFRHTSDEALTSELIHFFTKERWPSGSPSKTLVIGDVLDPASVASPRQVDVQGALSSLEDALDRIDGIEGEDVYDFILVDLRPFVASTSDLTSFLTTGSSTLFSAIRRLLVEARYCTVLVGMEQSGGGGFPLPWSIADSCRSHLRLRDEKVGLMEAEGQVFYALVMQAVDDERPPSAPLPDGVRVVEHPDVEIPAWTIPKPPPRKKNEVLHPAKYPETLVGEFVARFSDPGDSVIDPMVGTGSTVIAAMRGGRNGYGVDLVPEFVDIARDRVTNEPVPMLFNGAASQKGTIVQGDSTELLQIDAIADQRFRYAVTSPPYWSMLRNPGSENQAARRKKKLRLVYSEDGRDLGNVDDYEQFLTLLQKVYGQVAEVLKDDGVLTVVVKNVKRNHVLYPLAWDLTWRLCGEDGPYDYLGTTLWCQDDVGLKPFAVGIHWVSNILHNYCVHFKKRSD